MNTYIQIHQNIIRRAPLAYNIQDLTDGMTRNNSGNQCHLKGTGYSIVPLVTVAQNDEFLW